MKVRLFGCSGLAASLLAPVATAAPAPGFVSQRLLDEMAAVSGVPGMGAALWQKGRIVWRGSTGYRDIDMRLPVDKDTIFRLASVSKLVTATAAARLAEQNKLDLDAPVSAGLPWLDAGWEPINSRQLASHTSGLPHYQAEDAGRGTIRYVGSQAAVAIFARRPLVQPPAQSYRYSSWGYTLLGALVEQASGMPFTDYVRREVTSGLKIGADDTDGIDANTSAAYWLSPQQGAKRAPRHDFSYSWGGGGLAGTPEAVAAFGGRMLRNQIVSRNSFDSMLRPYRLANGAEVGAEDFKIGFGWRTSADEDGLPTAHHSGAAIGARSTLVLWRGEQLAVSLLSNAIWTSSIDRSARLMAAPFRPVPGGLVRTSCPVDADRYAGTLGDKPTAGMVSFVLDKELCIGTISSDTELRQWLSGAEGGRVDRLRLVGIDRKGGLARAGLVTPYGIYDWRAQGDGSFMVRINDKRTLRVRLSTHARGAES